MADDSLLSVAEKIATGRQFLDRLVGAGFEVSHASWVRHGDSENWSLRIVSPQVDEWGPFASYSEALRLLRSMAQQSVATDDIVLAGQAYKSYAVSETLYDYDMSEGDAARLAAPRRVSITFTRAPIAPADRPKIQTNDLVLAKDK